MESEWWDDAELSVSDEDDEESEIDLRQEENLRWDAVDSVYCGVVQQLEALGFFALANPKARVEFVRWVSKNFM